MGAEDDGPWYGDDDEYWETDEFDPDWEPVWLTLDEIRAATGEFGRFRDECWRRARGPVTTASVREEYL